MPIRRAAKRVGALVGKTFAEWTEDHASQYGAAMACTVRPVFRLRVAPYGNAPGLEPILAQEETMGKQTRPKAPTKSRNAKKPVNEPENLSPIPAAAPPEEPQVDELLPPDEKREYRRAQREQDRFPL